MPHIKPVTPEDATPEVQAIFAEIEAAFGMVPNLLKTYALHPPLLKVNWQKIKAVMMEGSLSRKVKESIAVLVSKDNRCSYCIAAHSSALQAIGVTPAELNLIENDLAKAEFSSKEIALIRLARKANRDALNVADEDVCAALSKGATTAEIVEALGVMELFAGFNRFVDSMQVEIDF